MKIDNKLVGSKIKQLRQAKGWSQGALGKRAKADARQISNYENGITLPSSEMLPRLAQALGVSIDHLLLPDAKAHATVAIQDHNLLKLFEQVAALPPGDKEIVTRFLEGFIVKNKLDDMVRK